mmetsp:Transcript_23851/g.36524  ORF Transcript_23851/g.36524 Transcript_23851/m.36524 type:complete len:88 (-) Transcript_23851:17-280(-)
MRGQVQAFQQTKISQIIHLIQNEAHLFQVDPNANLERQESWERGLSEDFFGLWAGRTLKYKKLQAIQVYRYFYRFSMEKLIQMIEKD